MVTCATMLLSLLGQTAASERDLIDLAKRAVFAEVCGKSQPTTRSAGSPKPVFITIEVKGQVRGCRGSLEVQTSSVEQEVIREAKAAASHDPRYRPLRPFELQDFLVTVTLVDRTEAISKVDGLKPQDGLVLRAGDRFGVVLPFEGRDPQTRLHWAFRKAGVPLDGAVQLYRLVARRFRG